MASISLYGSQPSGKGYYRLDITYTVGNGYITLNGATGYSTNGRYSGWDGYSRTHTFGFNGQTVNFTTSRCGFNSGGHTWAFTSTPTIYTSGTSTISVTCNSGVGSMNGTYTSSSQISVGPAATTPTINAPSVSNIGTTTANSSFSVANNGGAAIVDNYIDAAINNFSGVVSTIGSTSGTFSGLAAGTTYYVRANASNGYYRGYSAVRSFRTAPSVSINPVAASRTSINLNRSWSANASACYYYLYNANGTALKENISEGTTTSGYTFNGNTVSGLQPNTKYGFRIRMNYVGADFNNTNGTTTGISYAYTSGNAPTLNTIKSTPDRLTTKVEATSVTYELNASFKKIEVQYGTTTSYGTTKTSTSTSYNITGLQPNTKYYYRIRVQDNWDRWSSYKTGNFTTTCYKPSKLALTITANKWLKANNFYAAGTVTATGDINAPITNYTLYYKKASESSYTSVNLGTSTSWTIKNLAENTAYNIYFTATNDGGTTTSSTSNFTTANAHIIYASLNGATLTKRHTYVSINGGDFFLINNKNYLLKTSASASPVQYKGNQVQYNGSDVYY